MSYPHNAYGRNRRRGGGVLVAVIVLLVLVGAALVGGEFLARNQLEGRIAESASSELQFPTEAHVGGSALLALMTKTADSVRLTADGTATAPNADITPAMDILGEDVRLDDTAATAATLSGTITLSADDMVAATNDAANGSGTFLDQFTQVESITPNPATNTLSVSIGGLANVELEPQVNNGQLEMTPQGAEVFGIQIPDNVLGGTISLVNETVERLPDGVEITAARVVDGGLELDISGENVSFARS